MLNAGLHDHHLHLLAMAAAEESVVVGPPAVTDRAALAGALTAAPGDGWIRAVGYHESVAGDLDRHALDAIVRDRPLRVQHRSGHLWMCNSAGLDDLGLDGSDGRLFGDDERLRDGMRTRPPSLAAVGAKLARWGVTDVTDATPTTDLSAIEWIASEVDNGALPQRVTVMGGLPLARAPRVNGVRWGPVKFVIADHGLPLFDEVVDAIRTAHDASRPIAIHCVTAAALALALAAWNEAGTERGDRIEHGSVISTAAAERIADMGLVVVTQPGFIATRGDDYRRDVDPGEIDDLYRCGTLLAAGITVLGSTDAPFGDANPWRAIAAAVDRRTPSGHLLGADERVTKAQALDLFAARPG